MKNNNLRKYKVRLYKIEINHNQKKRKHQFRTEHTEDRKMQC